MRRRSAGISFVAALMVSFLMVSCGDGRLVNLTPYQEENLTAESFRWLSLVKLSGKINHFGMDITTSPPKYIDYHATVPGVKIWLAEYPFTKYLNITSDETGWWTIYVLKLKGRDLQFSLVYEKEGWITTKSNKILVTDEDNWLLPFSISTPSTTT